jgi:hypothetical protein
VRLVKRSTPVGCVAPLAEHSVAERQCAAAKQASLSFRNGATPHRHGRARVRITATRGLKRPPRRNVDDGLPDPEVHRARMQQAVLRPGSAANQENLPLTSERRRPPVCFWPRRGSIGPCDNLESATDAAILVRPVCYATGQGFFAASGSIS